MTLEAQILIWNLDHCGSSLNLAGLKGQLLHWSFERALKPNQSKTHTEV